MPRTVNEENRLQRLDNLGRLLDSSIRLPGGFRIGYDAIIGLIPGIGDVAGLALSAYIIVQAARLGTPLPLLARMVLNVGAEAVAGTVPVVGDVFDAGWKANLRNLNLMYEHLGVESPHPRPMRARTMAVGLGLAVVALLALAVYGIVLLLR